MIWPQLLVQENKQITYYLHTQYLPWSDPNSIAVSFITTPLYSSQNPFSFPQILKVHLTAKEKNHSRIFDWGNCVNSEGKADHGKWLRIYFIWSWKNMDNIKFTSLSIFVYSPVASSTLTLLCSHPQHVSRTFPKLRLLSPWSTDCLSPTPLLVPTIYSVCGHDSSRDLL